jgi:hypothetical protein
MRMFAFCMNRTNLDENPSLVDHVHRRVSCDTEDQAQEGEDSIRERCLYEHRYDRHILDSTIGKDAGHLAPVEDEA